MLREFCVSRGCRALSVLPLQCCAAAVQSNESNIKDAGCLAAVHKAGTKLADFPTANLPLQIACADQFKQICTIDADRIDAVDNGVVPDAVSLCVFCEANPFDSRSSNETRAPPISYDWCDAPSVRFSRGSSRAPT